MIARKTALALSLTLTFAACGGETPAPTKTTKKTAVEAPKPTTPEEHANEIFDIYCSTCHGKTGAGDGLAAAALDPKPRTFSDKKWQESVTDEHLEKVILEGGAAVKLSAAMAPAASWFKDRPEGTMKSMIKKIRAFAK